MSYHFAEPTLDIKLEEAYLKLKLIFKLIKIYNLYAYFKS